MRVSLRQVAKRAGVSDCTVSHIVNSHPGARVRPETRQRVLAAVAELGYQPNRLARSLGRRRTDAIGLLISGLRNPFFVDVLEHAEAVALAAGYQVFADSAPSIGGTFIHHSRLRGWPVDGALVWARSSDTLADSLGSQASEIPHVYLGYTRDDGAAAVAFDLYGGGTQVAEHLVRQGRRRIAYATPYGVPTHIPDEPRHQAYLDACWASGLPTETLLLAVAEETRAAGFALAGLLAQRDIPARPDAVICLNDIIAIGLCAGLRSAGVRVPEDIAVVGFDHIEEGQYLDRALTTVAVPASEMCTRALDLLVRAMAGEDISGTQLVLPVRLVVGGTA